MSLPKKFLQYYFLYRLELKTVVWIGGWVRKILKLSKIKKKEKKITTSLTLNTLRIVIPQKIFLVAVPIIGGGGGW